MGYSESFKLLSSILFVTDKLIEDGSEYWPLPDFAVISGFNKHLLYELESKLLVDILDFDLVISR